MFVKSNGMTILRQSFAPDLARLPNLQLPFPLNCRCLALQENIDVLRKMRVLELSASFEPKVMSLHNWQKLTKNTRLPADSLLQGLYLIKQALEVSGE